MTVSKAIDSGCVACYHTTKNTVSAVCSMYTLQCVNFLYAYTVDLPKCAV